MQHARSLLVGIIFLASSALADDPYSLIMRGRLGEASDSLANSRLAAIRDGNTMFAQSLIERDGAKAVRLMSASLDAGVIQRYQEVIYLRLAQYYYLLRDYDRVEKLTRDYHERMGDGPNSQDMTRLSLAAHEQRGHRDAAQKELARFLGVARKGEEAQWGEVDKARMNSTPNKGFGNTKALKKVIQQRSGACVAPALYALASQAIANDQIDDAILYVNLMREEYHTAVGLDALEERLGAAHTDKGSEQRANRVTGTYYSVKVGVFLNARNAREFGKNFAPFKEPIETESKTISGKTYQVVYVGRCGSFEEARQLKVKLEESVSEQSFQVVAR